MCFRTLRKVSGHPGKFPDTLESIWTLWKVSGHSGEFPLSGKFNENLENLLDNPRKFPDTIECLWILWKVSKNNNSVLTLLNIS